MWSAADAGASRRSRAPPTRTAIAGVSPSCVMACRPSGRQVRRVSVAPARDTRVGVEQRVVAADQVGERREDEATEDGDRRGRRSARARSRPADRGARGATTAAASCGSRPSLDGLDDVAGHRRSSLRDSAATTVHAEHPGERRRLATRRIKRGTTDGSFPCAIRGKRRHAHRRSHPPATTRQRRPAR